MSGESIAGLAVAGTVGLVAAGGAAGASCALVVGGGLTLVGTVLERRELRRRAAATARSAWESAALEVAVRNARIAGLEAGTATLPEGIRPALPAQLVLGSQTLEELSAWCDRIDGVLDPAEQDVARLTARELLARIMTGPESAGPSVPIDDLLATAMPATHAAHAVPGAVEVPGPEPVRADLVRVVARLAPDAPAAARSSVEAAAAKVAEASTRTEALNWLAEVRHRVDEANTAAERRRDDAFAAALLLQPLPQALPTAVTADSNGGRDSVGSLTELRRALVDVVAGRRPLEPWMRADAVGTAERIKAAADRRYVQQSVMETLDELGYTVDEGFQTGVPVKGSLRLVRTGWRGHGVRLRLDAEAGTVTAVVVRTEASDAWDADRQDVERQREWCASLDTLRERLREKGVEYTIESLVEPGRHAVPLVVPRSATSGEAAEQVRRVAPPEAPS